MSTGMVLDRSFRLYLENFTLMIALSAILNIPLLVISLVFSASNIDPANLNSATVATVLIGVILSILALLIIGPLIAGATTMAISDIYLGNMATAGAVLSAGWRKAWTLLKAQLIVGLMFAGLFIAIGIVLGVVAVVLPLIGIPRVAVGILIFLVFLAAVVSCVPIFLSYSLIAPVVMIEGSKNGRVIRQRSWELVKGNRGKVFLIFLVIVVIQVLVQIGIGLVSAIGFGPGNASVLTSIMENLVSLLLTPISAIAVTLLYYDFRIRKEGFDLEILSQSIAGPATEA
jgi:hypothetical protein